MSLILPDYPDPQGAPGDVIPRAYAWIEHLQLGFSDGSGRIVLWIHRSPEAAATWTDPEQPNTPPADQEEFHPGDGVIPTLPDLLADPEFAAAFDVIRTQLYGFIKANKYPDAIDVP
jgi:hypothetical protein